jgi:hypothetical protein
VSKALTFRAATDRLGKGVTHEDLARECGVSVQTVRQARLGEDNANHRPPPQGWELAVARLARAHGADLHELADSLDPKR